MNEIEPKKNWFVLCAAPTMLTLQIFIWSSCAAENVQKREFVR